jgi:hypothetical protein
MNSGFSQKVLLLIFLVSALTSLDLVNYIFTQKATSSSGQLVTVDIVNQNPKLPSTGYIVEHFHYSDIGETVNVTATVAQKAGKVFNLVTSLLLNSSMSTQMFIIQY